MPKQTHAEPLAFRWSNNSEGFREVIEESRIPKESGFCVPQKVSCLPHEPAMFSNWRALFNLQLVVKLEIVMLAYALEALLAR